MSYVYLAIFCCPLLLAHGLHIIIIKVCIRYSHYIWETLVGAYGVGLVLKGQLDEFCGAFVHRIPN